MYQCPNISRTIIYRALVECEERNTMSECTVFIIDRIKSQWIIGKWKTKSWYVYSKISETFYSFTYTPED